MAGSKKPKAPFFNDLINLTPTENVARMHAFQPAPTFYLPVTYVVGASATSRVVTERPVSTETGNSDMSCQPRFMS